MANIHKTQRKITQTVAVKHVYGESFVVMIYSYQKRIKMKSDSITKFARRNMESMCSLFARRMPFSFYQYKMSQKEHSPQQN